MKKTPTRSKEATHDRIVDAAARAIRQSGARTIAVTVCAIPACVLRVALRTRGVYFIMITLAFAQMVYFIAYQWNSVTGGENGLQAVPKSFFGIELVDSVTRLCAMNMLLHGIGGDSDADLPVVTKERSRTERATMAVFLRAPRPPVQTSVDQPLRRP